MQTLGERLRAEREKKGLSILELAGRTRIRAQYFEAIEADKPEEFPGRFFYRSFLRQYAGLLDLPEAVVHEEIERSIAEEQSAGVERGSSSQEFRPQVPPLPTGRLNLREETRRWMVRLSGLLGVVVLCSGVYFFWQRWGQRLFDESWRAATTRAAQPAPHSRPAAPASVPPPAVTQKPALPPDSASQPVPEAGAPATQAAGSESSKVDAPPAGVTARGTIEIRADADCWVSGWRDGKQFLAVTMHAGEARTVQGGGAVRLQFGSAGNVAIKVDGQALAPIGAKGESCSLEYRDGAYRILHRVPPAEPKP
jgi:cytoskeletal protein RodZ